MRDCSHVVPSAAFLVASHGHRDVLIETPLGFDFTGSFVINAATDITDTDCFFYIFSGCWKRGEETSSPSRSVSPWFVPCSGISPPRSPSESDFCSSVQSDDGQAVVGEGTTVPSPGFHGLCTACAVRAGCRETGGQGQTESDADETRITRATASDQDEQRHSGTAAVPGGHRDGAGQD